MSTTIVRCMFEYIYICNRLQQKILLNLTLNNKTKASANTTLGLPPIVDENFNSRLVTQKKISTGSGEVTCAVHEGQVGSCGYYNMLGRKSKCWLIHRS